MIALGNTKHLIMGGIVLTALGIGTYNSSVLMSVYEQKMPGYSRETKMADQKWRQLEEMPTRETLDPAKGDEVVAVLTRYRRNYRAPASEVQMAVAEAKAKIEQGEPSATILAGEIKEIEIQPPSVAGILTRKDARGAIRRVAIIAGRAVGEKDRVDGFTVKEITAKGVVLTKGPQRWFIPNPQIHFSVDHGG